MLEGFTLPLRGDVTVWANWHLGEACDGFVVYGRRPIQHVVEMFSPPLDDLVFVSKQSFLICTKQGVISRMTVVHIDFRASWNLLVLCKSAKPWISSALLLSRHSALMEDRLGPFCACCRQTTLLFKQGHSGGQGLTFFFHQRLGLDIIFAEPVLVVLVARPRTWRAAEWTVVSKDSHSFSMSELGWESELV